MTIARGEHDFVASHPIVRGYFMAKRFKWAYPDDTGRYLLH
jgi:hypothetical protein